MPPKKKRSPKRSPASTAGPRQTRPRSANRAEKAARVRNELFEAAAQIVGESGYLNAMVLAITSRAGVANGTFYNYFESQQDLFDNMLPRRGREMLEFIGEHSSDGIDAADHETGRFKAFFDYLERHPEFYRVLYEAEVFAPTAFDEHINQVTKGFAGILRRAARAGEITGYASRELDVLALILMGARYYIAMRYVRQEGGAAVIPDWVFDTYRKFVRNGLNAPEDGVPPESGGAS